MFQMIVICKLAAAAGWLLVALSVIAMDGGANLLADASSLADAADITTMHGNPQHNYSHETTVTPEFRGVTRKLLAKMPANPSSLLDPKGHLFGPGYDQYAYKEIGLSIVDVRRECIPKCIKDSFCTGFGFRIDRTGLGKGQCWFMKGPVQWVDRGSERPTGIREGGVWIKPGSSTPTTSNCPKKMVRIKKFCITGKGEDPGTEHEIQFRLMGKRYFPDPKQPFDCGPSVELNRPEGYCQIKEDRCTTLARPRWWNAPAGRNLDVGIVEHDEFSANEVVNVRLSPTAWYAEDICSTFEVRFSRVMPEDFAVDYKKLSTYKEICWDTRRPEGEVALNKGARVKDCRKWIGPRGLNTYVWYLEVASVAGSG